MSIAINNLSEEQRQEIVEGIVRRRLVETLVHRPPTPPPKPRLPRLTYAQAKRSFERRYFKMLLRQNDDCITTVARIAAYNRPTLYRKLKALGLR